MHYKFLDIIHTNSTSIQLCVVQWRNMIFNGIFNRKTCKMAHRSGTRSTLVPVGIFFCHISGFETLRPVLWTVVALQTIGELD